MTWFGIIQLASLGLAAAVIGPGPKRVDTSDPRALCRLLLVLTMIEAATMVAFGLAGSFGPAVAAFLASGASAASATRSTPRSARSWAFPPSAWWPP